MLRRAGRTPNADDCFWQERLLTEEVTAEKARIAQEANLGSLLEYLQTKNTTSSGGNLSLSPNSVSFGSSFSTAKENEVLSNLAARNNYIVAVTGCRLDTFDLTKSGNAWATSVTATCMVNIWDPKSFPRGDPQSEHCSITMPCKKLQDGRGMLVPGRGCFICCKLHARCLALYSHVQR